jgi:opacity protein-like surface antigen
MMQRLTKIGFALALAALGTFGLQAADDETEYSLKVGLVNPQGDLRTMTDKALGYGGELGWDFKPTKDMGVGFGLNAGYIVARGKKESRETFDAKATYAGVDLIYALGDHPLTIRTGLQVISWDVTSLQPAVAMTGAQGETTWKLGFRAGLEYRFLKIWSVTAMYDFSHWKTDTDANTNINPSFVTLMVGYKF